MKLGDAPLPIYRKTISGFVPVNEAAEEFHRKTKLGNDCTLEGRRPRLLAHHKKFWKLMTLVWENQSHYATPEQVCNAFKFAIGHYDVTRYKVRGEVIEHHELRSISFAAMDQTEFANFYGRAVTFLVTEVIPGLDREELEQEMLLLAA